ncbi:hypothetical protein ACE3MZ_13965 [Paenibacillus sp. WLX1005]|uniref:hypothetical protein n=1 Tax=Paenibacillus sp. WLX1005 TaxID=3243766 RepID=UPI003983DAEB
MFSQPIYIATLLLILLAVGELISIWSRARVPSLLVVMGGYLLLSWMHVFPQEVITSSAFAVFGSIMVAPLVVHMGTLIPTRLIRVQYKAILIALLSTLIATVLVLLVVSPIYGYPTAVAGAGPVTGGIIAYLITTQRLQEMGLTALVTVPAVILGIHALFGMPVALNILRRYALKMQRQGFFDAPKLESTTHELTAHESATDESLTSATRQSASHRVEQQANVAGNQTAATQHLHANHSHDHEQQNTAKGNSRMLLPERLQTPPILLLLLFLGGSLAVLLNNLTGLNYSIWALAIGIIGQVAGIFPPRTMDRANTTGVAMVGLIVVVMSSMGSVTLEAVLSSIGPVLLIIVVGVFGIMLGGWLGSKWFKWDPLKGIPVAMTALFGFPGDYIICEEVSRSVGRDERERQAILDEIFTPMLVGGFTTVTTASILIASVLINTL